MAILTQIPPAPPLPSLCPKGFVFEPGNESSKKSWLRDSWDFTKINQCTEECKKHSNCKAIQWSKKYWHCILLRRTSAFAERYEDYVRCAGTSENEICYESERMISYYTNNTKHISLFI